MHGTKFRHGAAGSSIEAHHVRVPLSPRYAVARPCTSGRYLMFRRACAEFMWEVVQVLLGCEPCRRGSRQDADEQLGDYRVSIALPRRSPAGHRASSAGSRGHPVRRLPGKPVEPAGDNTHVHRYAARQTQPVALRGTTTMECSDGTYGWQNHGNWGRLSCAPGVQEHGYAPHPAAGKRPGCCGVSRSQRNRTAGGTRHDPDGDCRHAAGRR